MKSRITIEIDYNNGNQPVIQILRKVSDDVRDGMISNFLTLLGGESIFCKIECVGDHRPSIHGQLDEHAHQIWHIRPVPYTKLKEFKEEVAKFEGYATDLTSEQEQ